MEPFAQVAAWHVEFLAHYQTLSSFHPPGDVTADLRYEQGLGAIVALGLALPWLSDLMQPKGAG